MKYDIGNIVLLHSGESMYIFQTDKDAEAYMAVNCNDDEDIRQIKDSDVFQLITTV